MVFDANMVMFLIVSLFGTLCLTLAVRNLVLGKAEPVRARLEALSGASPMPVMPVGARRSEAWQRLLKSIEHLTNPDQASKLREHLVWAGLRGAYSVHFYMAAKLVGALVPAGAVLAFDHFKPMPTTNFTATIIIAMGIGFYLPTRWLRDRIEDRQRALFNALPNALDLLVSCVEAGLSLDASFTRVSKEIELSSPHLASELNQTMHELNAGLDRADSFRRLAWRTGVPELKSLAAILVQTESFGTSMGQALRVLGDSLRVTRMQRAQERAASVAVRLSMPLVLNLMPALFAVILGGAVIRILRILLPTLRGG